ncbi:MAG: phosphodiester glycosidase family protein [Synergistaceae bacterium]|jgi:exopolysaccharide biosynthesis protein|nr:phosphodiester glycosidase family protein [Synergistaceae bacterium]
MKAKEIFTMSVRLALALFLLLILGNRSLAVTRAEFLNLLFTTGLNYKELKSPPLPRDVPRRHRFAGAIGSSLQYGLIPAAKEERKIFGPDETINGREAVRLALIMMGWGFEVSLCESLGQMGLYGTDDPISSLACEMRPPAPKRVIAKWTEPLSDAGKNSIMSWVRSCKKGVWWKKELVSRDTALLVYKRGIALPGVRGYRSEPFDGSSSNNPLYVVAVTARPEQIDAEITFAKALGRSVARLSEISVKENAVAAVNGGFFAGNLPVGTLLLDGVHAGRPFKDRPAVGWRKGGDALIFDDGSVRVGIRTKSGYVPITRFNSPPTADGASLYTSRVTKSASGIASDAVLIAVRDGTATGCVRELARNGQFTVEGEIVVARGRSREMLSDLAPGAPLRIVSNWSAPVFAGQDYLIQAGPLLLNDGLPQNFSDNKGNYRKSFLKNRHPRTIAGTDGAKIFWAVIDGRDPIHSLGATMEEAKSIALALGLKSAINLDGGGSSQLIWMGMTVNKPSGGKERLLPYAVIMKTN